MNALLPLLGCGILLALPDASPAQAVPTTPTRFKTKPVGASSSSTGAIVNPKSPPPAVRHITYLTLTPLRQWTSTDGKTLMGKLIAFEDTVTKGPVPSSAAPITSKPTVLRAGKARLLVDNKAYEVALDRLDATSQSLIHQIQTSIAAKP